MPEKGIRVEIEVPLKNYEAIEKLVKDGRYKSVNHFIDVAIKKLLEEEIGVPGIDEETLKIIKAALKIK